jgi:hypothetical protein
MNFTPVTKTIRQDRPVDIEQWLIAHAGVFKRRHRVQAGQIITELFRIVEVQRVKARNLRGAALAEGV